jgi:hypothetical protein
MSGKHTPGPWETRAGAVVHPWYGDKVVTIATVNGRLECHEDRTCSLDEAAANARLIAAAPDMAKTLQDAEHQFCAILEHGALRVPDCDAPKLRAMIREIRAALTKAGVL